MSPNPWNKLWRNWLAPMAVVLALPLVPAGIYAVAGPKPPAWSAEKLAEGEVSLRDVLTWPAESYLWVDARADDVYAAEHIPGALPLNEMNWSDLLYQSVEQLVSGKKVIVYCDSRQCDASKHVRERLMAEGITQDVYVLHGGWQSWLDHAGGGR